MALDVGARSSIAERRQWRVIVAALLACGVLAVVTVVLFTRDASMARMLLRAGYHELPPYFTPAYVVLGLADDFASEHGVRRAFKAAVRAGEVPRDLLDGALHAIRIVGAWREAHPHEHADEMTAVWLNTEPAPTFYCVIDPHGEYAEGIPLGDSVKPQERAAVTCDYFSVHLRELFTVDADGRSHVF